MMMLKGNLLDDVDYDDDDDDAEKDITCLC